MNLKILYEDKYIMCVEKEPGVPAQSDKTEDEDLMSAVKVYTRDKYHSDYVGLIHRLDRPVGGAIVYALNEFANRELSRQIQNQETNKHYLAVVCGGNQGQMVLLEDYLKKLKTINMSKISDEGDKQAKLARLKYDIVKTVTDEEYGELSLVEIELHTGRHHQIRVQMSNAGLPIWGDNKYNKVFVKKKQWTQIALWSHRFGFKHPKTKQYMEITSVPMGIYPFTIFADCLN